MLAVRLDNALFVTKRHRQEKVTELSLNFRVKMQLRLFEDKCRVRFRQEAHDQNRKHLANTYTDMGEVVFSTSARQGYLSSCPSLPISLLSTELATPKY